MEELQIRILPMRQLIHHRIFRCTDRKTTMALISCKQPSTQRLSSIWHTCGMVISRKLIKCYELWTLRTSLCGFPTKVWEDNHSLSMASTRLLYPHRSMLHRSCEAVHTILVTYTSSCSCLCFVCLYALLLNRSLSTRIN